MREKSENNTSKSAKVGKTFLRVLVLVLVFCVLAVGVFIISDCLSGNNSDPEPEIIAITVSDDTITLNDNEVVTLEGLKAYLTQADEKGDLYTVALINDTAKPADSVTYNRVVDLLAQYGIECEKMDITSTEDELTTAIV